MMTRLWFVLFALVFSALSFSAAQDNRAAILQEAETRYIIGDWAGAIAAFEQLVTLGVFDPALYINLGHSYAQLGDIGEALLNYRRAETLAPRDPQVLGFIASIIGIRRDQAIPVDTPLQQLYRLTADLVTLDELSTLILFLWTLTLGLWAASLSGSLTARRRSSLRLAAYALTIVLIPLLFLLGVRLYMELERPAAVLIVDQAVVRSGPAEIYMDLYTVYTAAEMRVLNRTDDWALVELGDGRLGWLPAETFDLVRTLS